VFDLPVKEPKTGKILIIIYHFPETYVISMCYEIVAATR